MTQLANETGLTENQIMTWFDQNKDRVTSNLRSSQIMTIKKK